jgi:hypothetical protein
MPVPTIATMNMNKLRRTLVPNEKARKVILRASYATS